jgi:hypothetical protein
MPRAIGSPRDPRCEAIYRFLRYALIFFVVGIAAQIAVALMQGQLHRWSKLDVVQLIFDRWFYDPEHKRAIVSFSEAAFSDAPVVEKENRHSYDIYVGLRARESTRPTIGECTLSSLGRSISHRPLTSNGRSRASRSRLWEVVSS